MKYKTGMFGDHFDPLHTGHIHDIIRAAAMCRELYVVISWCRGRGVHLKGDALPVDFKQYQTSSQCNDTDGGGPGPYQGGI